MANKKKQNDNTIALNKKALFDYTIEQKFEAGLVLEGWELKSARAGRVQLKDSYVIFKNDEVFLFGSLISPLLTTSTHTTPIVDRNRKLLLTKKQIQFLKTAKEADGYSVVALSIYWKKNFIKTNIALVKGKKQHDKRQAAKKHDWTLHKSRVMKNYLKN